MDNKEYLIEVYVPNRSAILNRITACFLKRHINIESLNVWETETKGVSKMTFRVAMSEDLIPKVATHLEAIYDVMEVKYYLLEDVNIREYGLFKIQASNGIAFLEQYANELDVRVLERNDCEVVVEQTGSKGDIDRLRDLLKEKGLLLEYSRSSNVAVTR